MKVQSTSSGQVIDVSDAHADAVLLKQGWKKYVVPVVKPVAEPVIVKEPSHEDQNEAEKESSVAVQDAISPRKVRNRRTYAELAAAGILRNTIKTNEQGPKRRLPKRDLPS